MLEAIIVAVGILTYIVLPLLPERDVVEVTE
jgi:hypothetical protein